MGSRSAEGLRVCTFTSSHHDTTDSRVVEREAVSLEEAGFDVTYYTPFLGDCPVDVVSYAGATSGILPTVRDRMRWAATLAWILLDTDYDVYHFHDVELLPIGVILGLLTDAVVIYDVHENVEDVLAHKPLFPRPVRPFVASAVSLLERTLARFVDGIVAASPDIAERFEGYEEVTTVTNYPRRTWAEETDLDEGGATADGEVRFVYCGLLSAERGILTLIDAIDRVPGEYDVSLSLGGKYASPEIEERIERRAAESDRVELVGWQPTLADVIDLFRESDVGLLCFHPDPNKTNAVHRSNKLFQYMAAGLPIVVSDVGDWRRLVEEVGCGVAVDPEDPDAIATAMARLASDPDRRFRFGRNGHEAALARFNWDAQCEELLGVYERLTGVESAGDAGERSTSKANVRTD